MYKCPKCGSDRFIAYSTVTQLLLIDSNGDTVEVLDDCVEILDMPGDLDIWDCEKCGYTDRGSEFRS